MHPYVKLHIMQLQRKPIDQSARGKIFVRNCFNVALWNKCLPPPRSYVIRATHHRHAPPSHHRVAGCARLRQAVCRSGFLSSLTAAVLANPMPRDKSFAWHYALQAVLKLENPWAAKYGEPAPAEMRAPRSVSQWHSATQSGARWRWRWGTQRYLVQPFVSTCGRCWGTSTRMSFMLLRRAAAWLVCDEVCRAWDEAAGAGGRGAPEVDRCCLGRA